MNDSGKEYSKKVYSSLEDISYEVMHYSLPTTSQINEFNRVVDNIYYLINNYNTPLKPKFVEEYQKSNSSFMKYYEYNQEMRSYDGRRIFNLLHELNQDNNLYNDLQSYEYGFQSLRKAISDNFGIVLKNYIDHFSSKTKVFYLFVIFFFLCTFVFSIVLCILTSLVLCQKSKALKWVTIFIQIIGIFIVAVGWVFCAYYRSFKSMIPYSREIIRYFKNNVPYKYPQLYNAYLIEERNIFNEYYSYSYNLSNFLDLLNEIPTIETWYKTKDDRNAFQSEVSDILHYPNSIENNLGSNLQEILNTVGCDLPEIYDVYNNCEYCRNPIQDSMCRYLEITEQLLSNFSNFDNSKAKLYPEKLDSFYDQTYYLRKIVSDNSLKYEDMENFFKWKGEKLLKDFNQKVVKNKSYYIMGISGCLSFLMVCSFLVVGHMDNECKCVCCKCVCCKCACCKRKKKEEKDEESKNEEKEKIKEVIELDDVNLETKEGLTQGFATDANPLPRRKEEVQEDLEIETPHQKNEDGDSSIKVLSDKNNKNEQNVSQENNEHPPQIILENNEYDAQKPSDNIIYVAQEMIDTPSAGLITKITSYSRVINIHEEEISAFILLQDDKILSGSEKGSICISNGDFNKKQWNCETKTSDAHSDAITSFCEMTPTKIISSSLDNTIKIWQIVETELFLESNLNKHSKGVNKVISSINLENKIISCSEDCTIMIWKPKKKTYEKEYTIKEKGAVRSILELEKHKAILLAIVENKENNEHSTLSFWDLQPKKKGKFVSKELAFASKIDSMLELNDGLIAVSSTNQDFMIYIVDPVEIKIVQQVKLEGLTGGVSYLNKYDINSFIFSNNEMFSQIEFYEERLNVLFKTEQALLNCNGSKGLLVSKTGKNLIGIDKNGFCILDLETV